MEPTSSRTTALSAEAKDKEYKLLQQKLIDMWPSMKTMTPDDRTIVVVPSIPGETGSRGARLQGLEERLLFLLLLLRQPRVRMVYVSSLSIHPDIIDYYLDLVPGVSIPHARKRLSLVSPMDGSPIPLTKKILDRPWIVQKIRSLIPNLERAHLVPYSTSELDRDLALELGIPMYGSDPETAYLGTKSGSREIFEQTGVRYPAGEENRHTLEQLAESLARMRRDRPDLSSVIVKLNESAAGRGNASVDLTSLPEPGSSDEPASAFARLKAMTFESPTMNFEKYFDSLSRLGGIIEERILGEEIRSPSAQLRITPLGDVEALSTHDQILGGPTGQAYRGCRFPADSAYSGMIMREALKIGAKLSELGVIGRFAVDFVTVRRRGGSWDVYAIEINLRKGGTTHPFLTLQYLTDGLYDAESGIFRNKSGEEKYLVATDHLASEKYRVFDHDILFDIVARHGLHFDQRLQKGVVLHMLNGVGELGMLGMTAVGNTAEEAQRLFEEASKVLDSEAHLLSRN